MIDLDEDDVRGAGDSPILMAAATLILPWTSPSEFLEASESMTYPFH